MVFSAFFVSLRIYNCARALIAVFALRKCRVFFLDGSEEPMLFFHPAFSRFSVYLLLCDYSIKLRSMLYKTEQTRVFIHVQRNVVFCFFFSLQAIKAS